MEKIKVKEDLFNARKDGHVEYKIWGKPEYTGIIERDIDGKFVPKLLVHESSSWCLIGIRPWFHRYTLYYGKPLEDKNDAKLVLSHIYFDILGWRSIDDLLEKNFPEKFVFMPD